MVLAVMIGKSVARKFMADWRIAIGKDCPPDGSVFLKTPSAAGYPLFLSGLLGLVAGRE